MADVKYKYTELPFAAPLSGSEVISAVQGGDSVQTTAAAVAALSLPNSYIIPLFSHYVDAGNLTVTKTGMYDDIIPANTLLTDGDVLEFDYGGSVTGGTSTKTISLNFGGVEIATSGALSPAAGSFRVHGWIMRKSSNTARAIVSVEVNGLAAEDVKYTPDSTLTAVDFSTGIHLVLYGLAGGVGAASNDIVAGLGRVIYKKHA